MPVDKSYFTGSLFVDNVIRAGSLLSSFFPAPIITYLFITFNKSKKTSEKNIKLPTFPIGLYIFPIFI